MAKSSIILKISVKWKFIPQWGKKMLIYNNGNFDGNSFTFAKILRKKMVAQVQNKIFSQKE